MPRCAATTKAGKRCRCGATGGGTTCATHLKTMTATAPAEELVTRTLYIGMSVDGEDAELTDFDSYTAITAVRDALDERMKALIAKQPGWVSAKVVLEWGHGVIYLNMKPGAPGTDKNTHITIPRVKVPHGGYTYCVMAETI